MGKYSFSLFVSFSFVLRQIIFSFEMFQMQTICIGRPRHMLNTLLESLYSSRNTYLSANLGIAVKYLCSNLSALFNKKNPSFQKKKQEKSLIPTRFLLLDYFSVKVVKFFIYPVYHYLFYLLKFILSYEHLSLAGFRSYWGIES